MFDCSRCGPCTDLNCYQRKIEKDCGEYIRKGFDKALADAAYKDIELIKDGVMLVGEGQNPHLGIVRDVQKRIYEALEVMTNTAQIWNNNLETIEHLKRKTVDYDLQKQIYQSLEKTKMPESAAKNVEDCFDDLMKTKIKTKTTEILEKWKGEAEMGSITSEDIKAYIRDDIKMTKSLLNTVYGVKNADKFGIKDVIFNDPATIVFWEDGTKTVVKAQNEVYDPEKGLAMAIAKKAMGNKHDYYIPFKKYLKRYYKGLEKK